jgi:hypothetical protein
MNLVIKPVLSKHQHQSTLGCYIPNKMKATPLRVYSTKPKTITTSKLNGVELVSHSIVYFTFYYCTFNWMYYRNVRKQVEKINKQKEIDNDQQED